MWYAGWDGGGTKTEVIVLDEEGQVIGDRSFGPLNPNGAGRDRVMDTVSGAVEFMRTLPGKTGPCGGLVIGAAGVSNLETREILGEALRQAGWTEDYRLVGDQEIALAGAIQGHGAILIAGTGAICHGRDRQGVPFRVGGYGYLIDDEGSGYAIGRDILTAVARAFDGRGRQTCLTEKVRAALGMEEKGIQRMITWLYAPGTGKKEVASLARLLPEALKEGDEAALAIAEKAAEELSTLAITGWRKTGMTDGELAMTGSILTKIPAIREKTEWLIQAAYPEIQIIAPRYSPAMGAARMAGEGR